ncbi:dipeptide ABC transporter ATP-binding protein [Ancylobacter mangrovi]|uniref:dipeptide ABC transporter ATP-binding protein n=1 Tax=Ancylobacter mangrovi TaxID=2972472 RepID=UPI0021629E6D|nr:dipeptide ABC transporter ATP-binding protein [Ancylobacter mangrovi]MCS0501926.1 dipeptide ABC transporter ATP-binding protein [Ancylobacter mangrovi]
MDANNIAEVKGLTVHFNGADRLVTAVDDLSFAVERGRTLAIVGESGSGKSVTSLALMRLVEFGGGQITGGSMMLRRRDGAILDLTRADDKTLRRVRGADVAMIFQEAMTSLNPSFPAGAQIAEALRYHQDLDASAARAEALRMLERVRIPEARGVLDRYPHQLSGGMRQRVMIAMALSCRPHLLIADEPTTALDVTVQAQILQLIRNLQDEMKMGVIFITHDMGVVAEVADEVLVMRAGRKVEQGPVGRVFSAPGQAYTRQLLAAVPRLGAMEGKEAPEPFPLPDARSSDLSSTPPEASREPQAIALLTPPTPILNVRDLTTRFVTRRTLFGRALKQVHAVEKVSFELYPGETLALVGESGSGKTTTGRTLLRLVENQSGSIEFDGQNIGLLSRHEMQRIRRDIQIVFQDPFASLNPRMTVGASVMEPLLIHGVAHGAEARRRVRELMERCGLSPAMAGRYPHEFSGGQRQRICIARALALNPRVLIADESVSALDVSIQAQIVNLLLELQRESGIAMLFISHDMAVVERVSHRVAVMYLGQIVEIGSRRQIFENPQHPYTRKLLQAVPVADPAQARRAHRLDTENIPSPVRAIDDEPVVRPLASVAPGHLVARHSVGAF